MTAPEHQQGAGSEMVPVGEVTTAAGAVARGPSSARWTGPVGDEDSYKVDEPSRMRRGGLGVMFEAVVCSDRHGPAMVDTRVGLKQLTNVDDYRWHKLEDRTSNLASVVHPNVARHVEVFSGPRLRLADGLAEDDDPQRYIVHVWVDGRPLAESVDAPLATVLRWLHEVAGALDHLHTHPEGPFAHRDLHPRNVIVNDAGNAVLIDFDTVFVGDSWTTTKSPTGSFTAPDPSRISPQAADRIALAKIALHVLAGDGDGAFDETRARDEAGQRLRAQCFRPQPAIAVLDEALAGRGPTTCAALISALEAGIGRRRLRMSRSRRPEGARHWRGVYVAGGSSALALAIAGALLVVGTGFGDTPGDVATADKPAAIGQAMTDATVDGTTTTTTSAPGATTTTTALEVAAFEAVPVSALPAAGQPKTTPVVTMTVTVPERPRTEAVSAAPVGAPVVPFSPPTSSTSPPLNLSAPPPTQAPVSPPVKPTIVVTDCGTDFGGPGRPSRNWGTGGWITNNDPAAVVRVTFEATLVFPDGHVVVAVPQQATVQPGARFRYDYEGVLPNDRYLTDEASGISHGTGACSTRNVYGTRV